MLYYFCSSITKIPDVRTGILLQAALFNYNKIVEKFQTNIHLFSAIYLYEQAATLTEQLNSEENGVTNGNASTDRDSEAPSSEHSDELSASSSSIEMADMSTNSSSWAKFAQAYFQVKGCHSYSCSALQQPLLPKKDKSDHLVSS